MELPVDQIRRIERLALSRGLPLMRRAGLAAARCVRERLPVPGPVLALAGPGNNGGDAMQAAAHLLDWGYDAQVVLPRGPGGLPPDARLAYEAWRRAGGIEQAGLPAAAPALVVDGLFGIGLNRPLGPTWQALVDAVNRWGVPVLALDVPSGLQADTGQGPGEPLRAAWTLSFIAAAPGLRLGLGPQVCGTCQVDGLGLDAELIAQALADASQG